MEWSATWGSPLSREQAEAKADQTIHGYAGLVHCLYDRRGALGLVYCFNYRQLLARRPRPADLPLGQRKKGHGNAD
jgi:hypothetical protein